MHHQLSVVHPNAAGIDIGSEYFFVDAGDGFVLQFPTYTSGCESLRDHLLKNGVTTVAMESTGVYWTVLYEMLEEAGIEVYLANGRDVKNLPGRKSDVKDCQWLRQLHTFGLLRKSFIPEAEIRTMRTYVRLRQDHIRAQATQVNLVQKALTQMNIRLAETINDVMGKSGYSMIKAILNGERDPENLLALCVKSLREKKGANILEALKGNYREEHLFALRQAVKVWEYYQLLIDECDKKIEKHPVSMTKGLPKPNLGQKRKRKPIRYNEPNIEKLDDHLLKLTNGNDPTGIAGITDYGFLKLVSEIGTDMSHWKTEKHFTSWLKLSPMKASSGKMRKRVAFKRHNKAGQLFRELADGIMNSKYLALGAFGRRLRARKGPAVAKKAIARKVAEYYYRTMTKGIDFVETGIQKYEEHLKEKQIKALQKLATKLNYSLVQANVCT